MEIILYRMYNIMFIKGESVVKTFSSIVFFLELYVKNDCKITLKFRVLIKKERL